MTVTRNLPVCSRMNAYFTVAFGEVRGGFSQDGQHISSLGRSILDTDCRPFALMTLDTYRGVIGLP